MESGGPGCQQEGAGPAQAAKVSAKQERTRSEVCIGQGLLVWRGVLEGGGAGCQQEGAGPAKTARVMKKTEGQRKKNIKKMK